jgi:hypothetical protein
MMMNKCLLFFGGNFRWRFDDEGNGMGESENETESERAGTP